MDCCNSRDALHIHLILPLVTVGRVNSYHIMADSYTSFAISSWGQASSSIIDTPDVAMPDTDSVRVESLLATIVSIKP